VIHPTPPRVVAQQPLHHTIPELPSR
jgi:hypothetical protein